MCAVGVCDDRGSSEMALKVLYWLVVLAISLALVVALILFLESRDQSSVEALLRSKPTFHG